VVILTRDSAIGYLAAVTVAPITSTIRGVPSEVALNSEDGMKTPCAVNLHSAVTVAKDRLGRRVAQLPASRMSEIVGISRSALQRHDGLFSVPRNSICSLQRFIPSSNRSIEIVRQGSCF